MAAQGSGKVTVSWHEHVEEAKLQARRDRRARLLCGHNPGSRDVVPPDARTSSERVRPTATSRSSSALMRGTAPAHDTQLRVEVEQVLATLTDRQEDLPKSSR